MTKFYKLKSIAVLVLVLFTSIVFAQAPSINSFTPSSGPVGTLVTITGTGLSSPTAISIGGTAAIVISNTGTSLAAMVMPGTTSGIISITTAGGTATSSDSFTITANLVPNNQQGSKLVGSGNLGSYPSQGSAVDLSADGNTAIVGAYGDDSGKGAVYFYTRSGGVWTQQGPKKVGTGGVGLGTQGWTVAISADGNTAIEGATDDNGQQGAVWIWTRSDGIWTQQGTKLVATGNISIARQGCAVDISADGNTIIVGGYNDNPTDMNNSHGAAWVWTRSGTTWTQQAKLFGSGATGPARQGISVGLSGDGKTAIVGGYQDNSGQGAAWVYTRAGEVWTQQGNKLLGMGSIGSPLLGNQVSLSADGNTAVVAGSQDNVNGTNATGAIWVFTRSGSTWSQQGNKLVGSTTSTDAGQGGSMAVSADGNTLIFGGQNDNNGQGAVWLFTRSNGTWAQHGQKLVGSGSVTGTGFLGAPRQGISVAISADGTTAIEGASFDNSRAGAVWVLSYTPPPVITSFTPASGPVGTLVTITGTDLNYPQSVAIGGTAAITSSNNGTALNAMIMPGTTTGTISLVTSSGTAISAGTFTVTAAKAPNSQQNEKLVGTGGSANGRQGQSVSVSADGNTAIVGAPSDNSGTGAAYIYTRSGTAWAQQTRLVGASSIGASGQGRSVSLSADGNTAIVGGNGDNTNRGAAWIYKRVGQTWTPQGKYVGTSASGVVSQQGYSVAISADGNTALVGGHRDNTNRGAVWIFIRSGDIWLQQGSKIAGVANAQLGASVFLSANGNTAILGANTDNTGQGAAWVYNRNLITWTQQTKLLGTGGSAAAGQGTSVSLSADGNTAISGGPGDNTGLGAAWVWTRTGSTWTQQTKLVGTGNNGNSAQGQSVSLSAAGNIAMVGGNNDNTGQGASWVYTRNTGTWTQGNKLIGTGNIGAAQQGSSVSLSADGSTAISSGLADNTNQGGVWVYTHTPPPAVTSFAPVNAAAGSTVTITGSDLTGATAVSFGGTNAASFTVVSATSITAVIGAGASGGIMVTTPFGSGTLSGFTFLSGNADLSALALSSGTLDPVFNAATITYTAAIPNASSAITVTPTSAQANATITVNGTAVTSATASGNIALNVGTNTITTVVTAQDLTSTKTYTLTATRAPSANTDLSALVLSSGTISPVFDAGTLTYTSSVSNAITSITLTPAVADPTATVTVNGATVSGGSPSGSIALNVGVNTITILLTAQDGTTIKAYTLTVTRDTSANADLSAISLSSGTLSPVFDAGTLAYTASVSNTTSSITLSPTLTDANATVRVNGTLVANGSASANIALNVGANTLTAKVTAQDGTTQNTYSVVIKREGSGDADLTAISLSNGTLSPAFAPGTLAYTASVDNAVTSIVLRPTANNPGSIVKVNGIAVANGTASGNIPLIAGNNTISVSVSSENGLINKTYTLTINRLQAGQIVPDQSGAASLNSTVSQVLITSPTQPIVVTVSDGTVSPSIDYGKLITAGSGTLPHTEVKTTSTHMEIPASTTVTASAPGWDGVLTIPVFTTYEFPAVRGQIIKTGMIIEVGSPGYALTFSKAIRLLLVGQAGMRVGRVHNNVYQEILLTGTADNQAAGDALAPDGSFKLNSSADMVVWTKVSSKFITFSQTTDLDFALIGADKSELTTELIKGSNTDISAITGMLNLPAIGSFGSAITWASDNPAVISADGKTIVRPVLGSGNKTVTMTASIKKGIYTETMSFTLTVVELPNQAPTLSAVTNQVICTNSAPQVIALSGISAGPESGQTTSLSVRSDKPEMFSELTIVNGRLNYRLNPGVSGSAAITLTVKDNGGIANGGADTFNRTFTLTVNPLPVSEISSDLGLEISKGLTVQLSVPSVTGATYSWANVAGIISGQNTPVLTVRPTATTTYIVNVTNSSGCSSIQGVTITVLDDYQTLDVNNLMTPDGDGTNDFLVIRNLDMYPNNTLKVFNRDGRLVFEKANYQNDWDGTYNGAPLTEATYFYIVDFGLRMRMMRGFVSIVRGH